MAVFRERIRKRTIGQDLTFKQFWIADTRHILIIEFDPPKSNSRPTMETYQFEGVVLPERAQISIQKSLQFTHVTSGATGIANISIILNQVAVWVDSEIEWEIFDLKNVVKNLLQTELAIVGYLEGYAYDLEIKRVTNRHLGIDYVFGIDIPCIGERNRSIDKAAKISLISQKLSGPEGILLHRCFNDLAMAMKNAEDTGFYCYRAIESLRQHCALKFNLPSKEKGKQWQKLKEVAQCDEDVILKIKSVADSVRHGGTASLTSDDRNNLFIMTWDIVDAYVQNI